MWAPFATKRSREGSRLWGRVRVQLNELPKFILGERLTGRAPEPPNVNAVVQKVNLHIDAKSSLGPPKNCGGLHSNHVGRGLAGLMGARPPNSAHGGSPPGQRSRCAHRPVRGASASVVCELRAPAARGCWLPGGTIPTAARLRLAPGDVGIAVSFPFFGCEKICRDPHRAAGSWVGSWVGWLGPDKTVHPAGPRLSREGRVRTRARLPSHRAAHPSPWQ